LDTSSVVGFVGFRVGISLLDVTRSDVADVEWLCTLDSAEIDEEVGGGFCELVKLGFEVVDGMELVGVGVESVEAYCMSCRRRPMREKKN